MARHRKGDIAKRYALKGGRRRRRPRIPFDIGFPVGYAGLYAVVLVTIHALFFPIGDTGVETDFYGEMAVAARELWQGEFAVGNYPYKGPVYSFVLILFYSLIREWYRSGVALNIVFAAAGLVVLYRFIHRLFNRRIALFTMISASLVSELFLVAHKASSDMLFFFLCIIVMERIVTERLSWARLCWAALFSALAFLTRYIGFFLPAAVVVTVLFINPAGIRIKRRVSYTLLYLCVFVVVCAPWFAASRRETGTVLSTRNLENVTREFYGDRDMPEGGFSSLGGVVSSDPLYFVTHYLSNIPGHFWRDMTGTLGMAAGILVILGLLRLLVTPPSRVQTQLLLFALFYFLPLCAVFHLKRFSIPLVPVYYAFAFSVLFGSPAAGYTRFGNWLRFAFSSQVRFVRGIWDARLGGGESSRYAFSAGNAVSAALIVVLVVFQVVRVVRYERMYYARRPLFVLPVARFLKRTPFRTRHEGTPVLMARKPHIAFYADVRFQYYPDGFYNSQHFLSFAIERDVDFIVVSPLEMEHYPHAEYLWNLDVTPGIGKIYETDVISIYAVDEWLNLRTEAGREQLERYEENLAIADSKGDPERVIRECLNVSGMYAMNGEWAKKAQYLQRALQAAQQLPDSSSRTDYAILLRFNISEAYLLLGMHEEGIALLDEYMPTIERHGTPEQLAIAHVLISRHHEEIGRMSDARRHLSIVLDIYRSRGDTKRADMVGRAMKRLGEAGKE